MEQTPSFPENSGSRAPPQAVLQTALGPAEAKKAAAAEKRRAKELKKQEAARLRGLKDLAATEKARQRNLPRNKRLTPKKLEKKVAQDVAALDHDVPQVLDSTGNAAPAFSAAYPDPNSMAPELLTRTMAEYRASNQSVTGEWLKAAKTVQAYAGQVEKAKAWIDLFLSDQKKRMEVGGGGHHYVSNKDLQSVVEDDPELLRNAFDKVSMHTVTALVIYLNARATMEHAVKDLNGKLIKPAGFQVLEQIRSAFCYHFKYRVKGCQGMSAVAIESYNPFISS